MNVLLTSCGRRAYLVRYFKEALEKTGGGKVFCVNSDPVSPCASLCDKFSVAPEIYDEGYVGFLLDFCKTNAVSAIIPLLDLDLPVLSAARVDFEKAGVNVVVSDEKVTRLVSDKFDLGSVLEKAGLFVPETACGLEDALEKLREGYFSYPLIVKPRRGTGSIETYTAENGEELRFFMNRAEKKIAGNYLKYEAAGLPGGGRVIAQRLVKGTEYGLDIISDLKGNFAGTLARKKIRMRSGETDACVTVSDPLLTETAGKIYDALSAFGTLRGLIDADVIVEDGKAFVIDMNARFGGGYPFSQSAGADVPLALVRWLRGLDAGAELFSQRDGVTAAKAPEIYGI